MLQYIQVVKMRSKKDQKIYDKTKAFLIKNQEDDIEKKMKAIDEILAVEDKKERYSYLYDLICDYLDNEFQTKNICGFHDGLCKRRCDMIEKNIKKDTYLNGCCHSYRHNRTCEHLDKEKGCQIKNIGCKTFTCHFLKKQGFHYSLDKIYLAKYFFNARQKFYIENTFFVDKDVIMDGILKRG